MNSISRRRLLLGGVGLAGAAALSACTRDPARPASSLGARSALTAGPGRQVVSAELVARATTLDLGGPIVSTWAYGDTAPGPLIRATAGDLLRITLTNQLPVDTTIHWHGIALRNEADGVPGLTQDPITAGSRYTYEFVAPDPGTYFYHPHVGVQLDRGLYAPLIVDDPAEPGDYDLEHVIVLDDWLDGTGRTPEAVLAELIGQSSDGGTGMSGMDHGAMGGDSMDEMMDDAAPSTDAQSSHTGTGSALGDAGDVTYPHYLVNGRIPQAPDVLTGKPGQRVRLRIVNAASDTIFAVALGDHRMRVTHSDGFPVQPREVPALYVAMGERYDVIVTLGVGVFPLVARAEGKDGRAMALVRTASGTAPSPSVRLKELDGPVLLGSELLPSEQARLPRRAPDVTLPMRLTGQMNPYAWGINGAPYGENDPLLVSEGQRVRLDLVNQTMMAHPFHLHGHTFALVDSGLRKDTVLLRPMESLEIEIDADNMGDWMAHCHNIYHGEAGMMIALNYR